MIRNLAKSCLILIATILFAATTWVHAAVETSLQNTLHTEAVPIDVAVSPDGKLTFVLTDEGNVAIYNHLGNVNGTIKVGTHIDQIEIGPSGERLFATSRQNKTVEIILLDFINNIETKNAEFKGPEDAPVTIAVFSEFQ
jgi:DNA-binding beta-propeller fold protein YncE